MIPYNTNINMPEKQPKFSKKLCRSKCYFVQEPQEYILREGDGIMDFIRKYTRKSSIFI